MLEDHGRRGMHEPLSRRQHEPGPLHGVLLHDSPLLLGQGADVLQDLPGHAHLPHVVEERADAQLHDLVPGKPDGLPEGQREETDVHHVVVGVLVVRLHGGQQQRLRGVTVHEPRQLLDQPTRPLEVGRPSRRHASRLEPEQLQSGRVAAPQRRSLAARLRLLRGPHPIQGDPVEDRLQPAPAEQHLDERVEVALAHAREELDGLDAGLLEGLDQTEQRQRLPGQQRRAEVEAVAGHEEHRRVQLVQQSVGPGQQVAHHLLPQGVAVVVERVRLPRGREAPQKLARLLQRSRRWAGHRRSRCR